MSRSILLTALLGTAGCWELLPASKDPLADATHHERTTCPATGRVYPAELLNPASVLSVSPLYFLRSEHGNQASHLLGATLALRPLSGLSSGFNSGSNSEDLERLLTCHGARSALHRPDEPTVPNDPYWAPGHVVRISVEFEEGATTVRLEGRDFEGAKAIFDRAQAFVQPDNRGQPGPTHAD